MPSKLQNLNTVTLRRWPKCDGICPECKSPMKMVNDYDDAHRSGCSDRITSYTSYDVWECSGCGLIWDYPVRTWRWEDDDRVAPDPGAVPGLRRVQHQAQDDAGQHRRGGALPLQRHHAPDRRAGQMQELPSPPETMRNRAGAPTEPRRRPIPK